MNQRLALSLEQLREKHAWHRAASWQPDSEATLILRVVLSDTTEHTFYRHPDSPEHADGIFVATPAPLPPGIKVRVECVLPGHGDPFIMDAVVHWVRFCRHSVLPSGMGLRFLRLDTATRRAIEEFLFFSTRDPILFDG